MPPLRASRRQELPSDILDSLSLSVPSEPGPSVLPPSEPSSLVRALAPRQDSDSDSDVIIPSEYGSLDNSPAPAAIAGIVLGSVAGFLLLIWFVYWCLNIGPPVGDYRSEYGGSRVTVSRGGRSRSRRPSHSHGSRGHHHHHHHSRRHSAARSRGGGPVIVDAPPPPPGGGVPMMERTRSVSRAPPPPHDDEDEVVVIEEHSPPPPRRSRSRRYSGGRGYGRDY